MRDIFLSRIHFGRIRHIAEIDIEIPKRKNLILTGKNGSGKSSLLLAMTLILNELVKTHFTSPLKHLFTQKYIFIAVREFCNDFYMSLNDSDADGFYTECNNGEFIFASINAHRRLQLEQPLYIERMNDIVDVKSTSVSENFLKFLVQLNYQKMVAQTTNNTTEYEKIESFFTRLSSAIGIIYSRGDLKLVHDPQELQFYIDIPGVTKITLNQLSDGYSAIFSIMFEIIMRMGTKLNTGGIVLIDEIETHLHVELQKNILPFLCEMFPNVQFIVSTHSPFVINSISDSVVYDMEKKTSVEDLSAYSIEGIVDAYFGMDMYSDSVKRLFNEYLFLAEKSGRIESEEERLDEIARYLNKVPEFVAEELVYQFRLMELKRKGY